MLRGGSLPSRRPPRLAPSQRADIQRRSLKRWVRPLGSPHIVHTRLETQALGALAEGGLAQEKIYRLYPDIERAAIEDALDLERQLAENLQPALAA